MSLHEVTTAVLNRCQASRLPLRRVWGLHCRRYASTEVSTPPQDMEQSAFIADASSYDQSFDPVAKARKRNKQLPPSRYQFHPPRYDRGPLHPYQPPPSSDPASREFVPGPFSPPRLEQTYHDTIAADLMTMSYAHSPPGHEPTVKGDRLRKWVGDNPYFKNRPARGPRGGSALKLLRPPVTFRNIPRLERVTVHTMVKEAKDDSGHLHVAGMVLQTITNVRAMPHAMRHSVADFGVRKGQFLSVTCELRGENMYHFLSKLVDVVMPKIKDWPGVKGSAGDSSGNLAFGLKNEDVALFPEIEVNYDMYPPKMIPGCHVVIHTSAKTDRDARLLLRAIGIPFYGKMVD